MKEAKKSSSNQSVESEELQSAMRSLLPGLAGHKQRWGRRVRAGRLEV